ncbi:calcium-binding protein [Phenylobacterium sp. J426]|uniref:calcium-binding protein n=1 Tax=Phenylobacterium sp. J426 TaxID=2898439 RepID=UPI002151C054|nr:calcium-binding protein [Phenylobacterium sp. J426]MCR5876272.1 calcium-binding protein [Phenylobacterium sp. J426]
MAIFTAGVAGVNFDDLQVGDLLLGAVVSATPTSFVLVDGPWREEFSGQFTYSNNEISGGTVTGWRELLNGQTVFNVQGFSVPATTFITWAATNNNETARQTIFGGSDTFNGSDAADRMYGYAGNDTLIGAGGSDYLRGGDGDDSLSGGAAFDDLHGNIGNDTVDGGLGSDWVVGGQGNDLLRGGDDASDDVVYGNLGDDTCFGGDGIDWVRGGQGDDSLSGGGGADLIWGDRGNDTISGGAGADIFSIFGEAGIDRILDFSVAEGDRLRIEAGYTYTTAQVGADVVVTLSGGAQAVLVGVDLNALGSGWIITG